MEKRKIQEIDNLVVLKQLRKYRVPGYGFKFVNREEEAKALISPAKNYSEGVLINRVAVIMGPRGCGKTELARALMYALNKARKYSLTYLSYELEENVVRQTIIYTPFAGRLKNLIGRALEEISGTRLVVRGALAITKILNELMKIKMLKEKHTILIVDEFRNRAVKARQELELRANDVGPLSENFKSLKIVYLTSDATASHLCDKIGAKVDWYLMWNMEKSSFKELFNILKPDLDFKLAWNLTGGNPRELLHLISSEKLDNYLESKIAFVRRGIEGYMKRYRKKESEILKEIKLITEDLNKASLVELWDFLIDENITMEVDARFKKLSKIKKEPWISDENAFQIPVFYWILKTMTHTKTLNLTPKQLASSLQSEGSL